MSRTSIASLLVWLLALSLGGEAQADPAEFRFLHSTPTETEEAFSPAAPFIVTVTLADPAALERQLRPEVVLSRAADQLEIRLDEESHLDPENLERFRTASFFVDFDAESVRTLASERKSDENETPEALAKWMSQIIEPSMDRGVDSASIVARQRRGDCTEFAVLFAALARRAGYPAAVAVGQVFLLSDTSNDVAAYGHAWTEVYVEGEWRRIDATPIEGGRALAYLREGLIQDEGPGFGLDFVRVRQAGIRSIRVHATPSAN